jgi:anti-sigma regulatory factor (Ser/Thr protein kinase)
VQHRIAGGAERPRAGAGPHRGFRHLAFFYRGEAEYLAAALPCLRTALAAGDAVLAAVPAAQAVLLREALGADARRVTFADIVQVGRNPGRIIPALHAFADLHQGRAVTCLGEPAWPTRSAAELLEATRHEALVNQAFGATSATFLCAYDARLPPAVLADAECTHPELTGPAGARASTAYLGPGELPPSCGEPLPVPPDSAAVLSFGADLRPPRALTARVAELAGLPPDRVADLVLAVSELAANTLAHTPGGGTLTIWHRPEAIVAQVCDGGWIREPLAGRRRLPATEPYGQGLWLVHQVCDLVELRTGPAGTTVRIHLRTRVPAVRSSRK